MVWCCFSYRGVGPIHKIDGILDQHASVNILQYIMLTFAEEGMPLKWTFQQDNDLKHTSTVAKEWFRVIKIGVLDWLAQSSDLNPIENLWADVKKADGDANTKNYKELFALFHVDGMLYLLRDVKHLWTPWEAGVQPLLKIKAMQLSTYGIKYLTY